MHPGLLPDVGLDGDVLLQRYAQVPDDFRAKVTLFGVQPGLSMLDQRLCLDKLGIWGFGVVCCAGKGSQGSHPPAITHLQPVDCSWT